MKRADLGGGRCHCGARRLIGIVADDIGRRDYCREHLGDAIRLIGLIAVDDEAHL